MPFKSAVGFLRSLSPALVAALLAACGQASPTGSCYVTSDIQTSPVITAGSHFCLEYAGLASDQLSNARWDCTLSNAFGLKSVSKAWVDDHCRRSDALGGCHFIDSAGVPVTAWSYVARRTPDVAAVRTSCEELKGTFVAP